jgi:small-conductance mechanosensitive channel
MKAVIDESLRPLVDTLDRIGFDLGTSRISVYSVLAALLVVLGVVLFGRIASHLARRTFARISQLDPAQQLLGEKLVTVTVWIFAIFLGIDVLGIDLTALTVFSGAAGLAIGFGLQKTFGNLIAGIILLMDRSIKPGDIIAVNDGVNNTFGQVKKIGIRAVSITTRDEKEYLIPNENLMINQVENWSYSSRNVRVKVPVSVAYHTDVDLAERLMLQATNAAPRVMDHPVPTARIVSLGESGINYEIRLWIDDPEEGVGNVRSDVLKGVLTLFRENNIRLAQPKFEIRVRESRSAQEGWRDKSSP